MRTIAHISDVHFGAVDARIADALVADINARNPSLLVASGDLTQRGRPWQYQAAAEFLARFNSPCIVVPGNHDISLYDVFRRFFRPVERFTRFITPDLRPVFFDDEMLVMGVNTARPFSWSWRGFWKDGRISDQQIKEVSQRAKQSPTKVLKIVVTHHPFIPPPGAPPHDVIGNTSKALASFETAGIDILLAGHLHQSYSGDVRSMLSIQAGTATSDRRRGQANAYNWITLDRQVITIEVRAWNGATFDASTTTRFIHTDHIWKAVEAR